MYSSVKSRVKTLNQLEDAFECALGVRQGMCFSQFLFSHYVNDLEEELYLYGFKGLTIIHLKMFFNFMLTILLF